MCFQVCDKPHVVLPASAGASAHAVQWQLGELCVPSKRLCIISPGLHASAAGAAHAVQRQLDVLAFKAHAYVPVKDLTVCFALFASAQWQPGERSGSEMGSCSCEEAHLCFVHLLQPLLMLCNSSLVVSSSQARHLLLSNCNGMSLLQHVQLILCMLNAF